MSGAIIPLPLMKPASSTRVAPIIADAPAPLVKVSVVPIARAAASQPHGSACSTAATPSRALSRGSGTPMTPVEDTKTFRRGIPMLWRPAPRSASTASRPRWPVKALELPALTISARAALCYLFAAHLDLARSAGRFGENAGDRRPFGQFGEGQIGAVPLLVPGPRNAQRDPVDRRQFGEGAGEGEGGKVHAGSSIGALRPWVNGQAGWTRGVTRPICTMQCYAAF